MTDPTLELRSHRPAIARDQVDALRRRLFGEVEALPEIPGYQIEQKLGEGSFGVVYRAFHPGFQRRVALKLIEYHSPRSLLRIDREAQALARLSHPNVVQVYDKGPAGDDRYYLALEYVEGVPLDTWLGQGPYPLPTILEKFLQIADGLSAAHAAGLVHRDLKPANAIVGSDGRVRVLDFGLARAPDATLWPSRSQLAEPPTSAAHDARGSSSCAEAESSPPAPSATVAHVISGVPAAAPVGSDGCEGHSQLERRVTAEGHFIGTPYYAAPEQHLGRADERSDQFSFCVALYEGVYGQKPYRLRAGGSLLDQLLAQSLQFPKARPPVPRWLTTLLQRGLQLDPDARHPSMRAIADELRYRLHHRPGRVRPLALAAAAVA
ncbi:MAG: serine/threonine protein kinase, partial [Myxococcales bacterium]|nr:serine/threonine protein kinase [Myxococcales bacterium]